MRSTDGPTRVCAHRVLVGSQDHVWCTNQNQSCWKRHHYFWRISIDFAFDVSTWWKHFQSQKGPPLSRVAPLPLNHCMSRGILFILLNMFLSSTLTRDGDMSRQDVGAWIVLIGSRGRQNAFRNSGIRSVCSSKDVTVLWASAIFWVFFGWGVTSITTNTLTNHPGMACELVHVL